MEEIYLIKSALVFKDNSEKPRWKNCYCVRSESEAKRAIILAQNRSNEEYLGYSFKFIYCYECILVL